VHSARKSSVTEVCRCKVIFFMWPDGYYYLDRKSNFQHNGHRSIPIADHHNHAIVSLNLTNKSSKSPTREYIIAKSQSIADQNFDARDYFCVARVSDNIWWCWNFGPVMEPSKNNQDWPSSALPKFVHVRTLNLHYTDNLHFVKCDFSFYNHIGIPCVHIFVLVGQMSCNMFHIHHFEMYNALYPNVSEIGQLLIYAQVCKLATNYKCAFRLFIYIVQYTIALLYALKE